MGEQHSVKSKKHICIGIVAHVDAGKTTLSESILYLTGNIRTLGRVDHGDTFLDTNEIERNRGITIFSKQAVFELGQTRVTLLDTPGHVDFSAEMERTLQVLDCAILVINGSDGVQGHTRTLWKLLKMYEVPVFIFINKMDQEGTSAEKLLGELQGSLSENCVEFSKEKETFYENIAMCDENALEEYIENGEVADETIRMMVKARKVFPCYFGSALKVEGVQEFLDGIEKYTISYNEEKDINNEWEEPKKNKKGQEIFGARIFKISRDGQGNRLSHMKITKGTLKVKDLLTGEDHGEVWEEKVNQIRIYSGEKFDMAAEVQAGEVCAVTGLNHTFAGQGLGIEKASEKPLLEPMLNYKIQLPPGCDVHKMIGNLQQLEEEDPMLHIVWDEELEELHAQLMGEVQIEILERVIKERFGVAVTFGTGNIVYKETIKNTAEGVGHFEPLRHYAEVHLILEAGEPGTGLVFDTICSEDVLDRNWQRLILTHLAEKPHRGVLTGAEITDMKITLAAGRAHLKHTEGGDFRQSTYRAVRQGLMQAESVLLEPYYTFRMEVPAAMVGRAMTDVQRMYGEAEPPLTEGDRAVLTGSAPVACMRDYQREVAEYTKGQGMLMLEFKGYEPCHNPEEVIEAAGYDPEKDMSNPTGSVFCAHGAGFYVPWDQVTEHMHIESQLKKIFSEQSDDSQQPVFGKARGYVSRGKAAPQMPSLSEKEEKELEEIFIRTYGKYERKTGSSASYFETSPRKYRKKAEENLKEYLLVDGYNIIFAWEDLKELAKDNIEGARGRLMDILSNYQGFKKCTVILVFDAYKVEGYAQEIQKYHNIYVVYTKEAETADQYIEKVVHEIGRKYRVTVATSDGVEQVVTLGQGGTLISAREFYEEIEIVRRQIREEYESRVERGKSYLFDAMDKDLAQEMEEVRLGRRTLGNENEDCKG